MQAMKRGYPEVPTFADAIRLSKLDPALLNEMIDEGMVDLKALYAVAFDQYERLAAALRESLGLT